MQTTSVLVVDDADYVARALAAMARTFGHSAEEAHSVEEALERFDARHFDVVLTDVRMSGLGGFDLLSRLRERGRDVPVVLLTGAANIPDAMKAMNQGAYDYLSKPVDRRELGQLLQRAIEAHRVVREAEADAEPLAGTESPTEPSAAEEPDADAWGGRAIIGSSPAMLKTFKDVSRYAQGDMSALVLGENGTGKELVARMIHVHSARRTMPFVVSNVASIAPGLAESELFGHVRGAFTGAHQDRSGLFEQASGGSLFLDEIGELELPMQAKLLRVLQEQRVKRVGANEELFVDVRLICATNRDLKRMVALREFREDLYFRIAGVEITLPPLRDRANDIPELVRFFLARYSKRLGRPGVPKLAPSALEALMSHSWPGNVRELENVCQRAAQLANSGVVTLEMLGLSPATGSGGMRTLREARDQYIRQVLAKVNGNRTEAARILGVSSKTLQRFVREQSGVPSGKASRRPRSREDNSS